MNILHIAYLTNSRSSGVNVVVPKYINSQEDSNNVAFINITNIKVDVNCQVEYNPLNIFESIPFNIDIVVFHECYRIEYIQIYKLLIKKNIPYVIIPHGELSLEAQKSKWLKKKVANLLIFNSFINHAEALQLLSNREHESTKFGVKHIIVPNGINLPKRKKDTFNNSNLKFIYIGRLDVYHKGLDLLIEAIARLDDSIKKHITLDIYGPYEKKYNKKLEHFIFKFNLKNIVNVHDALFGTEKETALLNSDVFIQTSRFEGMPMGILEALSYGLPVLTTEGTTLNSIVDSYDCGWIARNDAIDICNTIKRCFDSQCTFYYKSTNSISVVKKIFSWDKISKDTIKEYISLISRRECLR